jgi:hypothetical protein
MRPGLPVVSGREAIRVFEQLGYSRRAAAWQPHPAAPRDGSLEKAADGSWTTDT